MSLLLPHLPSVRGGGRTDSPSSVFSLGSYVVPKVSLPKRREPQAYLGPTRRVHIPFRKTQCLSTLRYLRLHIWALAS